jgi:hypothetical protein
LKQCAVTADAKNNFKRAVLAHAGDVVDCSNRPFAKSQMRFIMELKAQPPRRKELIRKLASWSKFCWWEVTGLSFGALARAASAAETGLR